MLAERVRNKCGQYRICPAPGNSTKGRFRPKSEFRPRSKIVRHACNMRATRVPYACHMRAKKPATRGRLARKHFSPGAHPAAETFSCLHAAMLNVSSSYERKHGSARSHIFTSVKTRRVKHVKLETNYKQKEKQSVAKLTRRPQFLQSTLAQLSSVQDGSAQLGSVKVGSTQLFASGSAQLPLCKLALHESARRNVLLHELRRAISHESGLRKLHCSRLLRASCSLQAAARKCSAQVALRKCSEQVALRQCVAPVAPCKRFAHVLCASWSVQVALRTCFAQVLCASGAAQVALRN